MPRRLPHFLILLVAGLALLAATTPPPLASGGSHEPRPHTDTGDVTEFSTEIGMASWRLPARLTVPHTPGPHAGLVLVHDAANPDLDGTCGSLPVFRELALALARKGVVVLRYEKRTLCHLARMINEADVVTASQDTVIDAALATRYLMTRQSVDPRRVFVLGYGFGGLLVPRILRLSPHVRGAILLGTPAVPLDEAVLRAARLRAARSSGPRQGKEILAQAARKVAQARSPHLSHDVPLTSLPLGYPASYWLDLRGYNVVRAARESARPLLVLQPAEDGVVSPRELQAWIKGLRSRKGVTFGVLPGLDHTLVDVETAASAESGGPPRVSPLVATTVSRWLEGFSTDGSATVRD